jgi:hypothetical protein
MADVAAVKVYFAEFLDCRTSLEGRHVAVTRMGIPLVGVYPSVYSCALAVVKVILGIASAIFLIRPTWRKQLEQF